MRAGLFLASLPVASAVFGKDTYAMSHPFAWKDFMESYFPTMEWTIEENSTETCNEWVKLCIDDGHTVSCQGPRGNFQLHAVGAYMRETGEKPMEQVEAEFTRSMGEMKVYDPYFENHMAFFTEDLDAYVTTFNDGNVPYFASTFTDPTTQTEYKSVLIQTPGSLAPGAKSLANMELLGSSSVLLDQRSAVHHHRIPRASSAALATAQAHLAAAPRKLSSDGKPVMAKVHRSFASPDLSKDVGYFENVLQGTKEIQTSTADAAVYVGKMLSDDIVTFRYVQSSASTQGPTSVVDWVAYQVNLHNTCFDSEENQGFDRLADNHWGHELGRGAALDAYILGQKAAGLPYRFYGGLPGGRALFLYLYGVNGWGVQVIGVCNDQSLCPSMGAVDYGFCTQGIKGHCRVDGVSDVLV
jgi:hypothetical protein